MGEVERLALAELARNLEGRHVCIALVDGTRIDDCQLVSAARSEAATLWLYDNGTDRFVALVDVRDLWEFGVARPTTAA